MNTFQRRFFEAWALCFFLFAAFFMPLETEILPFLRPFLQDTAESLLISINGLFHVFKAPFIHRFFSDSSGLYLFMLLLIPISFIVAFSMLQIDRKNRINYSLWFERLALYYLALQMLRYGFSKVFLIQFYSSEPNLLIQPLGNFSRDILFWTLAGSSPAYQVFSGLMEVLCAILLINAPTRRFGKIFSLFLCAQILFINLSFNISVKFFSAFLFLIAIRLSARELKAVFKLLKGEEVHMKKSRPLIPNLWLASVLTALIFTEALWPYLGKEPYPSEKPSAFEIQSSQDSLYLSGDQLVFRSDAQYLHLRGGKTIAMKSYGVGLNPDHYRIGSGVIKEDVHVVGDSLRINLSSYKVREIDIKQMPLLKDQFSWTVDGMLKD